MSATIGHLSTWLKSHEDEHLEFKEAEVRFHFERLGRYRAALDNVGV